MPGQGNLLARATFSSEIVGHGDTRLSDPIGNLTRGVGRAEVKVGVAWTHDLCMACGPILVPTDFGDNIGNRHNLYSINIDLA